MLMKTPDYTISACGCPQWKDASNSRKLTGPPVTLSNNLFTLKKSADFASTRSPHTHDGAQQRLLPLRETLTDHYARLMRISASDNRIQPINGVQGTTYQDPAQLKQHKNKQNDRIKLQKQQQPQQQQQQLVHSSQQQVNKSSRPNASARSRRHCEASVSPSFASAHLDDAELF